MKLKAVAWAHHTQAIREKVQATRDGTPKA
jgi:hypothetical protein